jgi:hypothetical protein
LEFEPTVRATRNYPDVKVMNLRPRREDLELAGNMKIKATTTIDRVFDSIMINNPASLNWKPAMKANLNPMCGEFAQKSFLKHEIGKWDQDKIKSIFSPISGAVT